MNEVTRLRNYNSPMKGIIGFLVIINLQCIISCKPLSTKILLPPTTNTMINKVITNTYSPTKSRNITSAFIVEEYIDIYFYSYGSKPGEPSSYDDPINSFSYLDLDTLELGNTPQSDIRFIVNIGSMEWFSIIPINNAELLSIGKETINLEDCQLPAIGTPSVMTGNVYKGNHLCAYSNQNIIYLLLVVNITAKTSVYDVRLLITHYKI